MTTRIFDTRYDLALVADFEHAKREVERAAREDAFTTLEIIGDGCADAGRADVDAVEIEGFISESDTFADLETSTSDVEILDAYRAAYRAEILGC